MSLASDRAARPTICAFYCIARQREKAKNGGPRKETAHGCQAKKKSNKHIAKGLDRV